MSVFISVSGIEPTFLWIMHTLPPYKCPFFFQCIKQSLSIGRLCRLTLVFWFWILIIFSHQVITYIYFFYVMKKNQFNEFWLNVKFWSIDGWLVLEMRCEMAHYVYPHNFVLQLIDAHFVSYFYNTFYVALLITLSGGYPGNCNSYLWGIWSRTSM